MSKVVSIQGKVMIKRRGRSDWLPARPKDLFYVGDALRVGASSRAAIVLSNESVLRIDQHTTLVFQGIEKKSFLLRLIEGAAYFFSREARSLKVATPFANGVVQGTEFLVRVDEEKTEIILYEGSVLAQNPNGDILIGKGQAVEARKGRPPGLITIVRPRDAVQWALYYPPILAVRPDDMPPREPDDWRTHLHRSMRASLQGNIGRAFDAIVPLGDTVEDARFYVYRASLHLSVGNMDQARTDIDRSLSLDARSSGAMALRSIMAVAQNRKDEALADARSAVAMNDRSAAAYLALSYALQASFDLESALDAAGSAVEAEPTNNIAQARLAELHLSTGDLDTALTAAQKAASLPPAIAHTQSILGYAYLTQIKIDRAKEAFSKAIALDSAAPLPRLGLGLARIREGDLKAGRAEIEIAAGLSPDNALIRSYLGKAYFDEKRDPLDERQFEMAKELDPKDPTPWFYDAIRKQTRNRPVEALYDLQKSVELNDNRAVYRSKLLLDQDRAIRGASLAWIYEDIGFDHVAQLEAFRSLSNDPANHSAHRWLSDSYSSKPGHEISQVSEALQSQLLQDININPVPLSLVETDLYSIGLGSTGAAFNEYNSLFERNRSKLLISGIYGTNETWGDEIAISEIYNWLSLSAGQFHYETDGYRSNNDREHDVYNIFAQIAVTPKLNLQAEWRRRKTDRGDITLNFDPNEFSDSARFKLDRDSLRGGGRLRFSPNSDLIASIIYKQEQIEYTSSIEGPENTTYTIDEDIEEEGYLGELQYLYQHDSFNLIIGAGFSDIKTNGYQSVDMMPRLYPNFPINEPQNFDTEHIITYIYTNVIRPMDVTWTVGTSIESYDDGQLTREKWNPKFGVQWQITHALRLRAAAFQTLKKVLILDQTVEPTQIAGFDQFMTDLGGSHATHYGFGLDFQFSSKLFSGIEINQREINVPEAEDEFSENWDESFCQIFFHYIANTDFSIRFAPSFENFKRNQNEGSPVNNVPGEIETTRIPLSVHWASTIGVFAELSAVYVHQIVELPKISTFPTNTDDFAVIDAALGFNLPNRIGRIKIEGNNIFDKDFLFQDNNFRTFDRSISPYVPGRRISGHVVLYF